MKFDTPAGVNPIDQLKVVGRATSRIEGKYKTTGTAPYAYEHQEIVPAPAYGFVVGSAIAKGRIAHMDIVDAKAAPGVIAVLTTLDYPTPLPLGWLNFAHLFGGAQIAHYHQAIALVIAETFEQARAAAAVIRTEYVRAPGKFDLAREAASAPLAPNTDKTRPPVETVGNFESAFAAAPVTIDQTYTTPDESHAMMEPHASIAAWDGDKLTVWGSLQNLFLGKLSLATALSIPPDKVHIHSPYIGGGFGGKLFIRADVVLAALGAKAIGRPVKVALPRPFVINNTTHRPATIQRVRLGATPDGKLTAISHSSICGNQPGGSSETAVDQTKLLYAAPNRETYMKLAVLDLPEGNAMRAPGEAAGMMALEIAMDELAEALGMDPVALRILNDTQVDPQNPERAFSERHLVECLRVGSERFGWSKRNPRPGQVREGRWLIGMGMAAGFRNSFLVKAGARVRLDKNGRLTVETNMTDVGTGSYTILAQTAAEMMGVGLDDVTVILGDSDLPVVGCGSGGQLGANSSTSGLYAACVKLREAVAGRLGFDPAEATFADGKVSVGNRSVPLAQAVATEPLVAEDSIEGGVLDKTYQQSTFASHFAEVAVDIYTGETRMRRMLAVCDAGRIINPKAARSQIIGAMTMGVGAALMEELAVDKRFGFFVNHDLASYEVPVQGDIPEQEVIFLDHPDDKSSPMKAKGVGELGLCGVGAAVANAVYNATGVRVRDYPITLDKYLEKLPQVA